jgi:predicted nucleic acid-binding Zn ribbon protein
MPLMLLDLEQRKVKCILKVSYISGACQQIYSRPQDRARMTVALYFIVQAQLYVRMKMKKTKKGSSVGERGTY